MLFSQINLCIGDILNECQHCQDFAKKAPTTAFISQYELYMHISHAVYVFILLNYQEFPPTLLVSD